MSDMSKFKVGANTYDIKDEKSRGVSLTWAQYQALSYEEQHNGTAYYITDMDAVYPVDHELNANSRNAVANDIVTPHILAMENVLGAKNQFALAYNLGTTGVSTANDELKNTLTDTLSAFVPHFRGIKNDDTQDFLFGDVISSAGKYEYTVTITSNYKSLFFKHNGASQDLGIYIPAVTTGRWILSFNVVGYNPSVVGGLEITEIMIRPVGTDPTYVPYSMTNEQLTERVINKNVSLCSPTTVTTGNTVTVDNLDKYKEIIVVFATNNNDGYRKTTMVIPKSVINYSAEGQVWENFYFSIFDSPSYYSNLICNFTNSTTLKIIYAGTAGWTINNYIVQVFGSM